MKQILVFLTLVLTCLSPSLACADGIEKWFYAYVDLLRDKVLEKDETNYTTPQLINLLQPLKDNGYSVIVLSSFQLADDKLMDPSNGSEAAQKVQKNLKAIADAVACRKMSIIPEVMAVGGSESILQNDKNLAEGTPVRNMLFHVRRDMDGKLIATPAEASILPDGEFVGDVAAAAARWGFAKDSPAYAISSEALAGSSSSLQIQFGPNLVQDFTLNAQRPDDDGDTTMWHSVKPWHQYRLSFAVRTSGLTTPDDGLGFYAELTGRLPEEQSSRIYPLERVSDSIEPTQKWTQYSTMLNTYQFEHAQLWFGSNAMTAGTAWITDIRLQEVGGANLIRRTDLESTLNQDESLPIKVRLVSSTEDLVEGKDFEFWKDELFDEKSWFRHDHPGAPIKILREDLEGKTLSVDYYHAALPDRNTGYVCCSVRHPKVMNLFRRQVARLNSVLQPTRWLINHDEIRAFGHDPLSRTDSPGKILRENLNECQAIITAANPNAEIIVFNDMYDPNHNALPRLAIDDKNKVISFYPMVNGEFFGSGDGMDRSTTILNWQTAEKQMTEVDDIQSWQRSLNYFNSLGTKQVISGFYDVVPASGNREQFVRDRTRRVFETAKSNGIQPAAVCYYSTSRDYSFSKDFAEIADEVFMLQ